MRAQASSSSPLKRGRLLATSVPGMSPAQFRLYNRLAEQMDYYHSILRTSWDELYAGTGDGVTRPSPSRLIDLGLGFCAHLKGHHDIEETMWFPVLGRKMEGFRPGHFAQEQHKEMHKGLDVLSAYLKESRSGSRSLVRREVREIMDSFGGLLWNHLDEEVEELGAANMRKIWSEREMRALPF